MTAAIRERAISLIIRLRQLSFLRDSGIYFGGSLINGLLPLALVPVFTRCLSPQDYGIVATSTVLLNIFVIVQGVNAYGLIARIHFDEQPARLCSLVSTATWLSLGVTVLLLALLPLGVGNLLGRWVEFPPAWLPAVVALGFFTVLQNNYQSLLQARKEPWRFVANQTLGNVLNMGISVWLVAGLGWDWRGRMWGLLVGAAGVSIFCLWGFVGRTRLLRPVFSATALRELLSFGIPLIPHVLGGWVMTMSVRLYLNNMASVAETGLFALAFNLTSPLMMLVGAMNKTYFPWLFGRLKAIESVPDPLNSAAAIRLCRIILFGSLLLLVAGAAFGLLAGLALPWIAGPKFHGANPYLFWLSMTVAVNGVYYLFGNIVIYSKKTHLMAWRGDFFGGMVVFLSCPLLIHGIGPVGAAVANCLGYVATTIGCITAARIAHPMPWGKSCNICRTRR